MACSSPGCVFWTCPLAVPHGLDLLAARYTVTTNCFYISSISHFGDLSSENSAIIAIPLDCTPLLAISQNVEILLGDVTEIKTQVRCDSSAIP